MEEAGIQHNISRDHPGADDRLQEGLQAFDDCRWKDAIPCFQEVVSRQPDRSEVVAKLAFALSQVGEYDQAVEALVQLCSDEPHSARWPYMAGYQFYMRARWAEAIEWFDKALLLNPTYIKALYRKGYAHFRLGQTDECEKALRACIDSWNKLPPELQQAELSTYGKANFILGKAYLARGLSLKARRPLRAAVDVDGDDPDRRYELGKCLLQNEDVQEAIKQLEWANRVKPGTDYIVDRLARAYAKNGDLGAGEKLYQGIPRHRRRPFILKNLGKLHLEQGRVNEALEELQLAARKDSRNHNIQYLLGRAPESAGRGSEALLAYECGVNLKRKTYGSDFSEAQAAIERLGGESPALDRDSVPNEFLEPGEQMGVIAHYDTSRGFGFISCNGQEVFFHITAVGNSYMPRVGSSVAFRPEQSDRGPRAIRVRPFHSANHSEPGDSQS